MKGSMPLDASIQVAGKRLLIQPLTLRWVDIHPLIAPLKSDMCGGSGVESVLQRGMALLFMFLVVATEALVGFPGKRPFLIVYILKYVTHGIAVLCNFVCIESVSRHLSIAFMTTT